jgi:flagellin
MADEVNLALSSQNVLLSMQENNKLLDMTNNHLSIGQKVASAVDDPVAYFQSKSLSDRASDFLTVKDQIDQGISLVQSGLTGISTVESLYSQMKGLVETAKTASTNDLPKIAQQWTGLLNQVDSVAMDTTYDGSRLLSPDPDPYPSNFDPTTYWNVNKNTGYPTNNIQLSLTEPGVQISTIALPRYDIQTTTTAKTTTASASARTQPATTTDTTSTAPVNTLSGQSSVTAEADYVFAIDTTGSMGPSITNVINNITSFIANNKAAGVDARYAFAPYKDINFDGPEPSTSAFMTDSTAIRSYLNNLATTVGGGGDIPESGLEALSTASDMPYRSGATKQIIMFTDADVHVSPTESTLTIPGIISTLQSKGIQVNVAGPPNGPLSDQTMGYSQLNSISSATGGVYGDVSDPTFYSNNFGVDLQHIVNTAPTPPPSTTTSMPVVTYTASTKMIKADSLMAPPANLQEAENWIDKAIAYAREAAAYFGTNIALMNTRLDFTNNYTNTLKAGSSKFTSANIQQEGANVLALQTRQSLSNQMLGNSAQNERSVIQLFKA